MTQAEALAAKLDRLLPEDTLNQKIYLPIIRSIIERERGNAVKAVDLLAPVTQYEQSVVFVPLRFFITVRKLMQLQESTPRLPPSSRRSSLIADGPSGKCLLRWRNSVLREPMPCKGTVRRAAKPTMISSPLGKTRIRISRYSAKPKPNIRNSLQPHLPPLQH